MTTIDPSLWSPSWTGTVLGIALATLRFVRVPALGTLAMLFIEFIRGTPLLVVLLITYFALPACLGYKTTAYHAALPALCCSSALTSRRISAPGFRSVRPGLIQAGLATGLNRWQVLRFIIAPQAIRTVIPTVFNQYIRLIKFTSVASIIGVTDLTGAALLVNARQTPPDNDPDDDRAHSISFFATCFRLVGRALYARYAVKT